MNEMIGGGMGMGRMDEEGRSERKRRWEENDRCVFLKP